MSIQLIQNYYAEVEKLIRYGGSRNESSLRWAFINFLESYASSKNLVLVPELELVTGAGRRIIPDGTLKNALRQDWGYRDSKDEADDIEEEIKKKFNTYKFIDYKEQVIDLLRRVCTVSAETMKIMNEMPE